MELDNNSLTQILQKCYANSRDNENFSNGQRQDWFIQGKTLGAKLKELLAIEFSSGVDPLVQEANQKLQAINQRLQDTQKVLNSYKDTIKELNALAEILTKLLAFLPNSVTLGVDADTEAESNTETSMAFDVQSSESTEIELLKKRVEKANYEKSIAEAEKAKAEADRAALDASLPTPSDASKPLDGTTTIDDNKTIFFESKILTYKALEQVSEALYEAIRRKFPKLKALVIFSDNDGDNLLKMLSLYRSYQIQREILQDSYQSIENTVNPPAVASLSSIPQLTVTTTLLRAVIDFFALFRTNKKVQGVDTTIPVASLVSQLASKFNPNPALAVEIYYPKLYSLEFSDNGSSLSESEEKIRQELGQLYALKANVNKLLEQHEFYFSSTMEEIDRLEALNEQFNNFIQNLFNVNPDSGLTPLSEVASVAKFENLLTETEGYLMYVKVETGGTGRTLQSLFNSRLDHSGGVIVNYMLFNRKGAIQLSDTLYYHTGYTTFEQPVTNVKNTNIQQCIH